MPQTTANADAVLKDFYLLPVREQLNNRRVIMYQSSDPDGSPDLAKGETVAFRGIDRDSEGVQFAGRQWVIPMHVSRNEGVGAIDEGGTLPVAGRQGWTDIKDTVRHNVGAISLTRFAIRLSNRDEGAFLKLLEGETNGLVDDISKDMCRQAYGDQTGALAAAVTDGANSLVVDTVQYLRVGMQIDLVDSTDDTILAADRAITALVASTRTVTYDGADAAVTTDHRVARTGNWKREINGLDVLIGNTGTIHGVDSTAAGQEWWQSVVKTASGSFSEDMGQQVIDEIGQASNGDVELLLTTRGVRRRYANTMKAQKRFNDAESVKLRGGFKALMFNDHPLVYDDDLPKGNMYFLNMDALMWVYLDKEDWDWIDDDGAILHRSSSRKDEFDGYLAADHDLAVTARNRLGVIGSLDDDTEITWR